MHLRSSTTWSLSRCAPRAGVLAVWWPFEDTQIAPVELLADDALRAAAVDDPGALRRGAAHAEGAAGRGVERSPDKHREIAHHFNPQVEEWQS